MDLLKKWWTDHGTKILGFAITMFGVIGFIDHETVRVVERVFGAHTANIVLIVSGVSVAYRGFKNSRINRGNDDANDSH